MGVRKKTHEAGPKSPNLSISWAAEEGGGRVAQRGPGDERESEHAATGEGHDGTASEASVQIRSAPHSVKPGSSPRE